VVSKAELNKRRVRAERAETQQREISGPSDRRRKRIITIGVTFMALMLVLPMAAGLVTAFGNADTLTVDAPVVDLPTTTQPAGLVDPGFEGAIVIGPTPCPATDGTERRATEFSEPPPICIGASETFDIEFVTLGGPIQFTVDATLSLEGTNLFVTLARFGVYEGAPIYPFPGVVAMGGLGDAGFRVTGAEPPADGRYPVGSVVMLTDTEGAMEGQVMIVTDETGAAALELAGQDPIIGSVTAGLESIEILRGLQAANEQTTYRVQATAVSTTS
jgi:hypothetical protein